MKRQFPQLFNRTPRPPPRSRRVTPRVEALEDRCVPAATIVVNTLADIIDTERSLRLERIIIALILLETVIMGYQLFVH